MTAKGKLRWILLVALAILIVAAFWMWPRRNPPQVITLVDGHTVTLLGVSYGRRHFPPGEVWRNFVAWIPSSLARKVGIRNRGVYRPDEPTLVVWFEWSDTSPTQQREYGISTIEGHESRPQGWSYRVGRKSGFLEGHAFPVFPRRDAEFIINAYKRSYPPERLAQFKVRNPLRRKTFPEWTPEPFPVTRTDGDMAFTLVSLEVTRDADQQNADHWTTAKFEIADRGVANTNWFAEKVWMTDATGNEISSSSWRTSLEGALATMSYTWPLYPTEPWKVRVEFSRRATAQFAPDELWTTTVTLPEDSSKMAIQRTNTLQNCQVILESLEPSSRNDPIQFQVSPNPEDMRLTLVQVTDQNGKAIEAGRATWGSGHYTFRATIPPESRELTITVALHRSRFVEYLVQPAVRAKE